MAMLPLPFNIRSLRSLAVSLFFLLALFLVWLLNANDVFPPAGLLGSHANGHSASDPVQYVKPALYDTAQFFLDFPLNARPYRNKFGELGRRTRILRDWLAYLETSPSSSSSSSSSSDAPDSHLLLEQAAASLFPFLQKQPKNPTSETPLADLRSSVERLSAGIIIPTGDGTIRYAAHLIAQLRLILGSRLPIQIVYAGDTDLSPSNRDHLAAIITESAGPPLEFLDIYTVFDDSTLRFTATKSGGWAVKAFAALGTRFEKVIVLDADAVFLQRPEVLFTHPAFRRTGAFLFHDRLLWQHAFADRHAWWKEEIRRPSATLDKSLVWTQDYAEECDSGVVVLNKGHLDVYMGLLHICWQNTYDVREDVTYKITYGDKESWWMGLELAGASYEMARHYGGIVGWEEKGDAPGETKVCSFVIAHVDDADRLLWYNGGLLRNKLVNETEYQVPNSWMIDAEWHKGGSKAAMSCMVHGPVHRLTGDEVDVLAQTIEKAKETDKVFYTGKQ